MAQENITVERENLARLADYEVLDRDGSKIGDVDAIWEDFTRQAAFIGVRTGWLGMGKAHVIPTQLATVNHDRRQIRLPYAQDVVKKAPAFGADQEIDSRAEDRIYDYYRQHGLALEQGYLERQPEYLERFGERHGEEREAGREERDEKSIPLGEERLKVEKRETEAGGVRLRKVVRSENVSRPVELKREDVVVERVPAGEGSRAPDFKEDEVFIPLRREEAEVKKEARITGEVHARKREETERREVGGTVRREDIEQRREGE